MGSPQSRKEQSPALRSPQGAAHRLCPSTGGEGTGEPRFFLLSKDTMETFGFCLHEELGCQGHIIRQVELGGLAQRRGLQDGDRLLQVNGHFVDNMDHRRVSWGHPTAGETPDPPSQGHRRRQTPLSPGVLAPQDVFGGVTCPGLTAWVLSGSAENQGQREPGPPGSAGW